MNILNNFIEVGRRLRSFCADPTDRTVLCSWTHSGLRKAHRISEKKFQYLHASREEVGKKFHCQDEDRIDPQKGYKKLDFSSENSLFESIKICRERFSKEKILRECSNKSKKNTLLSIPIDIRSPENEPLLDLALNSRILGSVQEYLGSLPVLVGAYVWYSPNVPNQDFGLIGSQLYHFDREDIRQIKCFIPIDPILDGAAALTLIPAEDTIAVLEDRKQRGLSLSTKQRLKDDEVETIVGHDKVVRMTCDVGGVALVDTTNCLHYGSRPTGASKYHITFHYLSPFSRKLYKSNQKAERCISAEVKDHVLQFFTKKSNA